MSMETLQELIRLKKSPVILGLNPTPDLVPPCVLDTGLARYGRTLRGAAEALRLYGLGLLETLADRIPAVLFTPSYYLSFGSAGIAAMEALIADAKQRGLYVIVDARCAGDSDEAAVSAGTWLGSCALPDGSVLLPWDCDALTVSGYGGTETISPYTALCAKAGKAVFLVAHTHTGSAREVQDLITGTRMVHTAIADLAVRLTEREGLLEACDWSSLGLVAGMNRSGELATLRSQYPNLFLLIPEYGVNGCRSRDVQQAMDAFGHGAAVCLSHQVLSAWKAGAVEDPRGTAYKKAAVDSVTRICRELTKNAPIL